MKRRKARATFAAYITINGLGGFQEKFISELITNDIQIYEGQRRLYGYHKAVQLS